MASPSEVILLAGLMLLSVPSEYLQSPSARGLSGINPGCALIKC